MLKEAVLDFKDGICTLYILLAPDERDCERASSLERKTIVQDFFTEDLASRDEEVVFNCCESMISASDIKGNDDQAN